MTITSSTLIRTAAVAAVAAGVIFIGVQINHPHSDAAAAVTTEWAAITIFSELRTAHSVVTAAAASE